MHEKPAGIWTASGVPGKRLFLQEFHQSGNPIPDMNLPWGERASI
jgi:hypothetical protein